MKSLAVALVSLGVGFIGGITVARHWQIAPPTPAPLVESSSNPTTEETQSEKNIPKPEPIRTASKDAHIATPAPVAIAPSNELKATNSTFLSRAIETLVSPQASFQQKREVWKQLREAGQLDQAIEALKQGAAENPASPEYPTAMGEGELQKAYVLSKNGGTVNQMGIAGMQADQDFDAALKLDPSNWEAQFSKAAAMSYWPSELNKGSEVINRLASLIDQQETMPPQPQFAQTYVLLGDQYQKTGQPDYASQTWQLGAVRFPSDSTLQNRIAGSRKQ